MFNFTIALPLGLTVEIENVGVVVVSRALITHWKMLVEDAGLRRL